MPFQVAASGARSGRLVEHCFADGRWWDQLILAIWRKDWMVERNRWPIFSDPAPSPG